MRKDGIIQTRKRKAKLSSVSIKRTSVCDQQNKEDTALPTSYKYEGTPMPNI